jgi:hypothetical protein
MRDEEGLRQQDERSVPSRGDRRQGGSKNSASSTVTLDGLTAEREETKKRRYEGQTDTVHTGLNRSTTTPRSDRRWSILAAQTSG